MPSANRMAARCPRAVVNSRIAGRRRDDSSHQSAAAPATSARTAAMPNPRNPDPRRRRGIGLASSLSRARSSASMHSAASGWVSSHSRTRVRSGGLHSPARNRSSSLQYCSSVTLIGRGRGTESPSGGTATCMGESCGAGPLSDAARGSGSSLSGPRARGPRRSRRSSPRCPSRGRLRRSSSAAATAA